MHTEPTTKRWYTKEIESRLEDNNTLYTTTFLREPDNSGYCYTIETDYGFGIFSDSNSEHQLKMFIVSNSSLKYSVSEDLTEDQFMELPSCVEISNIQEFVHILSNPIQ